MLSIQFETYTLPNGLDVILHRDDSLPMVAVNLWYHVGSKDEQPGRTGFAHLFEHIMFEGSKHHNRDFFEPLEKVGASINGSTTNDRTNYWTTAPSNTLELILWLESDRMGYLLDALDQERLDLQRDVVKNERRQSYENRPYGRAHLAMETAIFPAPHPYNWPVIGSQEDLDAASLDDVRSFFKTYYVPSNASLGIAGDFDPDQTRRLVDRYFGSIPPGDAINRVGQMNSSLTGELRLDMRDKVHLPRLSIVWPTGPVFGPHEAPLDILSVVMGEGQSSRLYKTLVYDRRIARDVVVDHYSREIAGEFVVQIMANPGQSLEEIEEIVHAQFDGLYDDPPTERELQMALNQIETHNVRSLERIGGFGGRADQLNLYNVFAGDPGRINTDIERYRAVTIEDVLRVAREMLGPHRVRLTVMPEEAVEAAQTQIDRSTMPASEKPRSFLPPKLQREKMDNGLDILYVEDSRLPVVSFSLVVDAGAVDDPPDKPGLSHLTAAMLPEGTSSMSSQDISGEMEFIGSHLASSASYEHAFLSASSLTGHWPRAMEILSGVARDAVFPEHELERVRKERLTDLQRIADDANLISRRAYRTLVYGRSTPHGNPIIGTDESIRAMTRDEIVERFRRAYRAEASTLIVVGDVRRGDILAEAESRFSRWVSDTRPSDERPKAAPPSRAATTIYLADKPGAAQSVIRAGHLTIARRDPDYYALNLLNYLFGGHFMARLNQNLRQDKGYSYGFHSAIDWSSDQSMLTAWGAVQTKVTKESVIETLEEFENIRTKRPVERPEFDDARNGLLKGFPSQFETQSALLSQLGRIVTFGLPDDYFSTLEARYESLTVDDINRAAVEHLDNTGLTILVVGDRSVVLPGLSELGYPIVHVDYEGGMIA